MWEYVRRELDEGKILQIDEYAPDFLGWAGRYLRRDPARIIASGESLAGSAASTIRHKMRTVALRREAARAIERTKTKTKTPRRLPVVPGIVTECQQPDNAADCTPFRHWLDEVDIIMPLNDQSDVEVYAETDSISHPYGESDIDSLPHLRPDDEEVCRLETFQGQQVSILGSAKVRLDTAGPYEALTFCLGKADKRRLMELSEKPRIFFSSEEIQLRVQDITVYKTPPIERLLASAQGAEWFVQLTHGLGAIRRPIGRSAIAKQISNDEFVGGRWKDAELRRKLLRGSLFTCTESSFQGTTRGRVNFRCIQLYVPRTADYSTVSVKCFLAPEGQDHPCKCVSTAAKSDPANRLGIQLRYSLKATGQQEGQWANVRGDANTKKINTLVDILEGYGPEHTEKQPRRFLDRGHGRTKISYTS
jgi:hypothetical protein